MVLKRGAVPGGAVVQTLYGSVVCGDVDEDGAVRSG